MSDKVEGFSQVFYPFLHEQKKAPPELSTGDAVRLPKYGRGRVAALEDDKVSVSFPDGETRTFKRDFVKKVR